MLRKALKTAAAGLVILICLGLAVYVATGPERPHAETASAAWLESGAYQVGRAEFVFVDDTRPPEKIGDSPPNHIGPCRRACGFRETSRLRCPDHSQSRYCLEQNGDGLSGGNLGQPWLLVAATDYPLTSGSTAGGANAGDVVNQPADISFLIDSLLRLRDEQKPFSGSIDESRIGLSGYSLGGLTTYLATYHPTWRDSRIAAALAIAGPSAIFAPRFFETSSIPMLAIAGTSDALIEHARNAADLRTRARNISVITIEGGTHLGFIGLADPAFRFMDNQTLWDAPRCWPFWAKIRMLYSRPWGPLLKVSTPRATCQESAITATGQPYIPVGSK